MALILSLIDHSSGRAFNVAPLDIVMASVSQPPPLEGIDPNASTNFTLTSTGPTVVYRVRGSWDVNRQLFTAWRQIDAALATLVAGFASESYLPTFVCSGGGAATLIGDALAEIATDINSGRTNVLVRLAFAFAPAVAGVSETVTWDLPPSGTPPGNFVSAQDACGGAHLQNLHAATDFCTIVQATVGALTVEVDVTSNPASSPVTVVFSYSYVP